MTTEPMTIDSPSWEFAVQIYLAVLENPDANFHQVVEAKEEILRLARMVDKLKQNEPTIMTKRQFYCVSYGMGVAVSANTGDRYAAAYHSFNSSTERDEYVSEGGDFRTSPDWRESLLASDRELKSEIKHGGVITCRA